MPYNPAMLFHEIMLSWVVRFVKINDAILDHNRQPLIKCRRENMNHDQSGTTEPFQMSLVDSFPCKYPSLYWTTIGGILLLKQAKQRNIWWKTNCFQTNTKILHGEFKSYDKKNIQRYHLSLFESFGTTYHTVNTPIWLLTIVTKWSSLPLTYSVL